MSVKNPKPSVLMVTYHYAPAADGGAARQSQRLAEGLSRRGRDVGVVTARFPGSLPFERVGEVDVNRVWTIPKQGVFSATFLPSLARYLLLHGKRYDIWHVHQAFYHAGLAVRIARFYGKPCVVKDASSGRYGDIARLRRAWQGGWVVKQLRAADAVVTLNSEMTTELLEAGVPSLRIRHIPNGVDCRQYAPASPGQRARARADLGVGQNEVVALYAGRLAEDTGTRFMIQAWQRIEQTSFGKPWTLIVIGDELGVPTLQEEGERLLRRARFVGKVGDIRPFLHAADLLVRPSLNEGMSNIVLEAMASGLAVVASDTGGLKEQVDDNVTGVLVPAGDARALADGLTALLQDEPRRAKMGVAGRARVEVMYSVDAVVDAYERLYAELTS
jgi:glycosyltransferase involved in cell wall biosynthesis